jgi:hypothetical protein
MQHGMQPCPSHRDGRSAYFGNSAVSETRKLAAILVSDVVGYSRLAGADEDRILARLRTLRSDLIDPTIAVLHGRIVKRTDDGSIIEFRSVVDAVNCAIEVQRAMVERNASTAMQGAPVQIIVPPVQFAGQKGRFRLRRRGQPYGSFQLDFPWQMPKTPVSGAVMRLQV